MEINLDRIPNNDIRPSEQELPLTGCGRGMVPAEASRLPRWLKRKLPKGDVNHFTAQVLQELKLHTVCEEARCPNRPECYAHRTATFLILGDICTRGCRFCSVRKGKPLPPDPDEPRRVAEAVYRLGLRHVVLTCVTRDDLPDGGASQFIRTIEEIRRRGDVTIEILPSDLGGNLAALDSLIEARPDVYNYNTETVPRLYRSVRGPQANYRWTLTIFRRIRELAPEMGRKTGLMLGLGETVEEVLESLAELADAGCQMVTIGQYLRPSPAQMPVARYVPPEEFEWLGELARRLGFREVASGPFVRSSYHAAEMFQHACADK
ncbi:MAG: lipoyl synthase [Thermoguttaceae bacterium]|nr:lipoyl synthase [Thermoguttaceae bacterium]MDW8079113.1 lipoyl synthase [Thermoguttaceae bacterium]